MTDITKTCSTCLVTKLVSEYYRDASKKDGCQLRCIDCEKRAKKKRLQNKQSASYKKSMIESVMREIKPTDY